MKKDVQSVVDDNMETKSAGTTSETNQGISLGLVIVSYQVLKRRDGAEWTYWKMTLDMKGVYVTRKSASTRSVNSFGVVL